MPIKKKKKQKKGNQIFKLKRLDSKDKIIFDNFKEKLEEYFEELITGTIDLLENIEEHLLYFNEKEFNLSKNQLISICNELIRNEELSFNDKRNVFFKTTEFIIKLDETMSIEHRQMVNDINQYTSTNGAIFEKKLMELSQSVIQINSINLNNTIKIYMDITIQSKIKLLNNIIKDVFDYIKGKAIKNLDILSGTQYLKYCEIFYKDTAINKHMLEISEMFFKGNYNHKVIKEKIKIIKEINEKINLKELEEDLSKIGDNLKTVNTSFKKYEKEKHCDFKELEEIALNNGYEFARCRGDHYIYINKNKKHTIPIPRRTIGTGLSIAIKKELLKGE